ncbi:MULTISPECIES: molybdopterin molybdotransferase MoeA [Halomicrobium]|uniref:Molybdenum cofactor synthesis domain protein n=2 Tax=Halomicrobium mukohataei TaxID=57705 RepID=C7NYS0_HALMD|nr:MULTISPECIES: gephyrin-like molybdotransferase Glp [Halomicrobium]ACV48609.1 molybdenum cofactor synthesis domain protein [Halomicrobium mukohataei DSM 12286]QCD67006.1 molybdopterin molybdotransferase MoeA [Halomicrobium mukohataei]QFR21816.1 molybdopterin molybdenumtransferase MoeA [Halomicrobium sp. ZPS1]
MTDDPRGVGFREQTRLGPARERLLDSLSPVSRTEAVPITDADGRALASEHTARRPVPHYPRAAMDGFAVRAEDTFGATRRSPVRLERSESVGPNAACRVHTGSELPEGADAVVQVEQVEADDATIEVFDAVASGQNVAPVGDDVSDGQHLFDPGHQLRPSDLGLLKALGVETVAVFDRPRFSVVPTGEELVQSDPEPGEVVETNGQTVAQYVRRWGGEPTYRDVVTDDEAALRSAIERDLDHDLIVTTGGSSVGERDLLPAVVDDLGTVSVHGVALKPGHPVAFGRVEETPILVLPGYPVATIVNAVQLLRPALKKLAHLPEREPPVTEARLERKVASEVGTRSFVRVRLDRDGDERTATPTRASGAGVLSSVALADGWVVVPEDSEGYDAGRTVAVEDWEWSP